MALPHNRIARDYYRAAFQRYTDATFLIKVGRTTAAVYLAGYTVECILKALVLASVPLSRAGDIQTLFRGNRGHNIEWLTALYRHHAAGTIPIAVNQLILSVSEWSTDLRYETGSIEDADEFIAAVVAIKDWADGRM